MGGHDQEPRRRPTMLRPGAVARERPELNPDWVRGVQERGLDRDLERYHREPEPAEPPRQPPSRPLPPPVRRRRARGSDGARPDRAAGDRGLEPAPVAPLESVPPETVSSQAGPPERAAPPGQAAPPPPQPYYTPPTPPDAYYTPSPPPEPPPPEPPPQPAGPPQPIPWSPPPEPLTLAPDYTFEEAMRLGAEWAAEQARERARRRLEFYQRYGVAGPTWVDGPDGPVVIAGHPYPEPEPLDVLRYGLRGIGSVVVGSASWLSDRSDDVRQGLIDRAERIGEQRGLVSRYRTTPESVLDHALIFAAGIGGGLIRAVLEIPSGILSTGEIVGRLLLLLYLEDLERGERRQAHPGMPAWAGEQPGTTVLSLQDAEFLRLGLTPEERRTLLREQQEWFQRLGEGIDRAIDDWLDEYDRGSSEQRISMIGQLVGEIIPALLGGGRGAPRGSRVVAELAETAEHARRVIRMVPDGRGGVGLELAPAASGAGVTSSAVPVRISPSPALGAVVMSSALPPGETPPGDRAGGAAPRGRGTAERGVSGRGVARSAVVRRSRRARPRPRSQMAGSGRRMSRVAYREVAERLTRIEVQAARRVALLRQLRSVRRAARALHGDGPAARRLRERWVRQEQSLRRRLGIAEVSDAGLTEQIRRAQGLIRALPEVRRTLRSADLDDAARQALRELDLEDHTAIADRAYRVRQGHRRVGQTEGVLPAEVAEAISASDWVADRRAGVVHNIAGRLVEQLGQRIVDPRARAWAAEQARRLGRAEPPVRGRLRTWGWRRGPDGEPAWLPAEAGDIGAYAAPSGGDLMLYVVAEAKSGAPAEASQIAGMMRRLDTEVVEFIADDGRRFTYQPGRTRSGDHTLLVTHGVADRAAPALSGDFLARRFGEHRHTTVPLTYEQAREIAARYAAAIPDSRRAPRPRRFQPVPAESQPPD